MEHHNIHIGQLIREQLKADQRSVSWLAREIGCTRNHLYKVFRKPSLEGELLLAISLAMNFNFFQYYTAAFLESIKARIGEE
ncbi:MAG: XRE family transcriptional regulator [Bacteroidales bacterium]|nr:XRE family transcriptional regulator [Bacteroidales bacterium]